jgi:hypothetical protein
LEPIQSAPIIVIAVALAPWKLSSTEATAPTQVKSIIENDNQMSSKNSMVAIYDTHDQAGVDMNSLSIVG